MKYKATLNIVGIDCDVSQDHIKCPVYPLVFHLNEQAVASCWLAPSRCLGGNACP